MVPKAGFEPARPKSLPPQDSVSTNFTTSANHVFNLSLLIQPLLKPMRDLYFLLLTHFPGDQ